MPGLVRALVLAVVVVLWGTSAAQAQAFKPRGKTPSTKPAARATAAQSKQPTRAIGPTPRRVVTTKPETEATTAKAPAPKAKPKGKHKGKEDIVIVDDDEDDVQIKDE